MDNGERCISGDRGKSSVPFRVFNYMKEHRMTSPGDRVLAAVSGGADSVCLLHVLSLLKDKLNIGIMVFHVNHHVRAEADRDADFVQNLSEKLSLPFDLADVDMPGEAARLGLSEEEAGRNLRYEALQKAASRYGCSCIATAHNAGDLAETVVMNLFRGTGLKGLTGIRPVRDNVIRPILFLERKEIEEYLLQTGETWVDDCTNKSADYTRNRVRMEAIPWAEENIAENVVRRLERTSAILSDIQFHMEAEADRLIAKACPDGRTIDSALMRSADIAVRREALLRILELHTSHRKDITSTHIEMLCDFMEGTGSADLDLPYALHAKREYDRVFIYKNGEKNDHGYSAESPSHYTVYLDCDRINVHPVWRTRRQGDYIIYGAGQRKTIKKLFIDKKIPRDSRDSIPLLCDGDEVLWIPGIMVSERYKAEPGAANARKFTWPQEEE
ncbi:MAG: tRNA lysidine(34) synthetase TilS [Lachnospiraceae bacterium]|nr:tRNA lysidine(34) synthetase TilS [Lachnospiraceae bacterium]